MLEIPESATIARQINEKTRGKIIVSVRAGMTPHKLAWYSEDTDYGALLSHKTVDAAIPVGGQVEIQVQDVRLLLADGVNIRYFAPGIQIPAKHQLLVAFEDGASLVCTVQMYGGVWAFEYNRNNNPYYLVAKEKPSPLCNEFDEGYFDGLFKGAKPSLSAKALLAAGQRIPGLGNGVLQDILFNAGIHPKTKISALDEAHRKALYKSVKTTLTDMTSMGGRDTEKDLFGALGRYRTLLSAKTLSYPCPQCGGGITRQAYMGGNIYFCAKCQPI